MRNLEGSQHHTLEKQGLSVQLTGCFGPSAGACVLVSRPGIGQVCLASSAPSQALRSLAPHS